jgi:L-ascorbate metabolism protein UlaG (beta-lactamase superfamily)
VAYQEKPLVRWTTTKIDSRRKTPEAARDARGRDEKGHPTLEIAWLGHACFRIKGRDATIITDPYERSLGLNLGRQTAEIVTVSHDTPNHGATDQVVGQPRIVRGPGEYEIRGVMISGVSTAGERTPSGFSRNTAYAIEIDELLVCHLGDLGKTLTADQIEALKDADVLLVPVGGLCTVSPAEAAEVVSQLEPKLVVPMHYQVPGINLNLEPLDRFCREMGVEEVRTQPKLTVTRSSLPDETTVTVLELTVTKAR